MREKLIKFFGYSVIISSYIQTGYLFYWLIKVDAPLEVHLSGLATYLLGLMLGLAFGMEGL